MFYLDDENKVINHKESIKDLDLLINEVYFLFSFGIRFIVCSFIVFTIFSFFRLMFFVFVFGN